MQAAVASMQARVLFRDRGAIEHDTVGIRLALDPVLRVQLFDFDANDAGRRRHLPLARQQRRRDQQQGSDEDM